MPTRGSQGPFPGPIAQLGPAGPVLGPGALTHCAGRTRTRTDVSPVPPLGHGYLPPCAPGPEAGAVPSQRAIASLRLLLCSLVKIRLMWFFTVFSLMKQVAAIC
ncbi:hypothetical protein FHX80_113838 [Streptomyces brevispora]|uniref:Uncharacterized protein n=1 Tax=Streptomyces brevispora TaxID=887462 RepID=A0A561V161_9ACTN|nr:hypothetical protein FHX80_113838 [Streptomyces brevispora]